MANHLEAYAKITGKKQGAFKGDSKRKGKNDSIQLLGLELGAKAPRDQATGNASGKRQYEPIEIEIEMGPPATQLLQALATNEVLTKAEFEIYKHNEAGAEEVATKITLTDSTVSDYHLVAGEEDALFPHVRIGLTFARIEIEASKTSMMDDWIAR